MHCVSHPIPTPISKVFPSPKSHMQGVLQCGEDGGGSGGHSPVIVEW